MTNERTYHGYSRPFDVLSDSDVQKVIEAVFQLMQDVGVKFDPDPRAMELFGDAGCDISTEGMQSCAKS